VKILLRSAWAIAVAAVLSPFLRLAAQDVTVGEPGWFQADGVPDQPPHSRWRLKPGYPAELSDHNAGEPGYVIVNCWLDAKGQSRDLDARSAYPLFKRSVEESFQDWQMLPAKRGGQAVAASFWIPIIFNPKSAAPGQPNATPRLVAVTPVIVPPAMMRRLEGNPAAWGTVSLDAAGVPQRVALDAGAPGKLLPYVEAALKQWKFEPARKGGQAVAADFRVAFLFYPPMAPVPTKETPPRVKYQAEPDYPSAMRKSGIRGEVLLAFVVDKDGVVRNPVVVRSNNPAFNEPAIEAVLKWKFDPATVDGRALSTQMSVPIIFMMDNRFDDGREEFAVEPLGRKAQQQLPEDLRYDVAPKPRGVVIPVFPYRLLHDDQKGKATVLVAIDHAGNVVQTKIVETTLPEFGLALVAAAETFKFDPALKDGHPVPVAIQIDQEFVAYGDRTIVTDDDRSILRREKKKPESIVGADKLDAPLKPLSRRSPVFPLALRGNVARGKARIELLIDEEGHARLPRIVDASEPAFGYAAAQAVAQWLFEPPRSGGKPAVVRVIVPFEFEIKPPALGTAVGEPAARSDTKRDQNPNP
jgi:TonB family protein